MPAFRTSIAAMAAMAAIVGLTAASSAVAEAYVVNEIQVTDPVAFKAYADQSPATLVPFGGRYIVRGGGGAAIGGPPPAPRIVILAFPDRAKALAWHASPAYQAILKIRDASSTSRVYVVDGVAP